MKMGVEEEKFMALYRHWMWADIIRENFDNELRKTQGQEFTPGDFADRKFAYMCIWYGMLYGVLEQVKQMELSIDGLENTNGIFDSLRPFRNAVFHPQAKYLSEKFMRVFNEKDSVVKIRTIHDSSGKFFLEGSSNILEKRRVKVK
jgi:hypothetical protein